MPEIERTFLAESVPGDLGSGVPIEQAYLARDGPVEVRVRRTPERCELAVKSGGGLERSEVEIGLEPGAFDQLWDLAHIDASRRRASASRSGRQAAGQLELVADAQYAEQGTDLSGLPPCAQPAWSSASRNISVAMATIGGAGEQQDDVHAEVGAR